MVQGGMNIVTITACCLLFLLLLLLPASQGPGQLPSYQSGTASASGRHALACLLLHLSGQPDLPPADGSARLHQPHLHPHGPEGRRASRSCA